MAKHGTNQKLPKHTSVPGGNSGTASDPWTDPIRKEQADRAGGAGKQLHQALNKSKSTGIKL